jgi:hypothetical protein
MPDGLTPRTTAVLVALVFGLAFSIQAIPGGGSSPKPPAAAKGSVAGAVASDVGAAQPDLRLVAAGAVPALREPRKPRKPRKRHVRKPKRSVRQVAPVTPTFTPEPTATPEPVATAAPRYIPPAPAPAPRQTPAPIQKPAATPAPTTAPPDSGVFDTSGEG